MAIQQRHFRLPTNQWPNDNISIPVKDRKLFPRISCPVFLFGPSCLLSSEHGIVDRPKGEVDSLLVSSAEMMNMCLFTSPVSSKAFRV